MPGSDAIILLYVPCGSEDEAVRISTTLIEERLIACANVFQSRALYMWQGKLTDEREYTILCKTASARAAAAQRRVRDLHSYDVPCIVRLEPASVNVEYARWVLGEVLAPSPAVGEAGSRIADGPASEA